MSKKLACDGPCDACAVKMPKPVPYWIAEQVGVDVLGASAHVILLEATDFFADGSFDLSLGSQGNSPWSSRE